MNFIDELAEDAAKDEYFTDVFCKVEIIQAKKFFKKEYEVLTEKELVDVLRFADILSRSNNHEYQNKSYKVVSLLVENYENNEIFRTFASSILIKMGNFPAIKFLEDNCQGDSKQPFEVVLERSIKEIYQQIPESDLIFTDPQYEIFERLKKSNHFSFSGPTSLGKSFIINS